MKYERPLAMKLKKQLTKEGFIYYFGTKLVHANSVVPTLQVKHPSNPNSRQDFTLIPANITSEEGVNIAKITNKIFTYEDLQKERATPSISHCLLLDLVTGDFVFINQPDIMHYNTYRIPSGSKNSCLSLYSYLGVEPPEQEVVEEEVIQPQKKNEESYGLDLPSYAGTHSEVETLVGVANKLTPIIEITSDRSVQEELYSVLKDIKNILNQGDPQHEYVVISNNYEDEGLYQNNIVTLVSNFDDENLFSEYNKKVVEDSYHRLYIVQAGDIEKITGTPREQFLLQGGDISNQQEYINFLENKLMY